MYLGILSHIEEVQATLLLLGVLILEGFSLKVPEMVGGFNYRSSETFFIAVNRSTRHPNSLKKAFASQRAFFREAAVPLANSNFQFEMDGTILQIAEGLHRPIPCSRACHHRASLGDMGCSQRARFGL